MPPKRSKKPEFHQERIDMIFDSLPKLGSAEYIAHLKKAKAAELPAQVLVRAYR